MRASWNEMDVELEVGDIHTRSAEWDELSVRSIELPPGADLRPLLAGLPGDRCACPHWGYVLEGAITLRYADGSEEVSRAGDLYFWPGGHTAWTDEGVRFVEFSPAAAIRPVLEHLGSQLSPSTTPEAAGTAAG